MLLAPNHMLGGGGVMEMALSPGVHSVPAMALRGSHVPKIMAEMYSAGTAAPVSGPGPSGQKCAGSCP